MLRQRQSSGTTRRPKRLPGPQPREQLPPDVCVPGEGTAMTSNSAVRQVAGRHFINFSNPINSNCLKRVIRCIADHRRRAFLSAVHPIATTLLRESRMTRRAMSGLLRCNKVGTVSAFSLDHCVGARESYLTLNLLASPSNIRRSPVMSRISNRARVPSWCCRGMPSTRTWPLSTVLHTVGKSFPLRTSSVHNCARSCERSKDIFNCSAATISPALIQIK
jgi:hypothetical protein